LLITIEKTPLRRGFLFHGRRPVSGCPIAMSKIALAAVAPGALEDRSEIGQVPGFFPLSCPAIRQISSHGEPSGRAIVDTQDKTGHSRSPSGCSRVCWHKRCCTPARRRVIIDGIAIL